MAKDLCVAIAVAKPEGLDEIPGAVPSAKRIAAWAKSQSYDVELVTDESEPVTCGRLAQVLHSRLGSGGHNRLIISFAGHGLIRGAAEEFWLLTGWRTRATEAVNYLKLRDRLGTYRPKQIALISDACRSLPVERAKWVEGNGVVDVKDYVEMPVQIAQLSGTRSAQPAYSTPLGAEEAYCFFTQVLANALEGAPDDVVEMGRDGRRVVFNDRLYDVVERELPRLASRYQRRQVPDLQGTWRHPSNIWSVLPDGKLESSAPLVAPSLDEERASFRSVDQLALADATSVRIDRFATKVRQDARGVSFDTGTGLVVRGADVADVVASSDFRVDADPLNPGCFKLAGGASRSASVLVALQNRCWIGVAAYVGFIGTLSVGRDGAESYVLRPAYETESAAVAPIAKAAMGADLGDPYGLAAALRDHKHTDPVLGALASYVYARTGAIDEIRRLCYFYAELGQPAPFDCVLLARVPVRRDARGQLVADVPAVAARRPRNPAEEMRSFTYQATRAHVAHVAGNFPWLRQGWALLEDDFRSEFRQLSKFAEGLLPSLFTTLKPTMGNALAETIRMGDA